MAYKTICCILLLLLAVSTLAEIAGYADTSINFNFDGMLDGYHHHEDDDDESEGCPPEDHLFFTVYEDSVTDVTDGDYDQAGERAYWANPIYSDAEYNNQVGYSEGICTLIPDRESENQLSELCTVVLSFTDTQESSITFMGSTRGMSILSGTGSYENAHGTVMLTPAEGFDAIWTVSAHVPDCDA